MGFVLGEVHGTSEGKIFQDNIGSSRHIM